MARPPVRSAEPPPMELGDRGVRWRRDGPTLHIRRGPTFRALLFPVLIIMVMVWLAHASFRDGDFVLGGFFVFALVFAGAFLWMRIVHRAEISVAGDGMEWKQHKPRPFYGSWSRDRYDGLRVYVHARSRWLEPRQAHVELRVDGAWTTFVFSGSLRRAARLAEDLGLATGLVPDRVEADD